MGTMTDSETYNGYANRETWAFNLHWQNDEGLYEQGLEAAAAFVDNARGDGLDSEISFQLGEHMIDWLEELLNDGSFHPDTERMIRSEIGSMWRVDRKEVGEAFLESLDAES